MNTTHEIKTFVVSVFECLCSSVCVSGGGHDVRKQRRLETRNGISFSSSNAETRRHSSCPDVILGLKSRREGFTCNFKCVNVRSMSSFQVGI